MNTRMRSLFLIAALVAPVQFAISAPWASAAASAPMPILSAPLPVLQKKKIPDDPDIEKQLEKLEEAYKDRKASKDAQGIEALNVLIEKFEKLNNKQQHKVLKETKNVFRARRKPSQATLYLSAAEALSRFGEKGAEDLKKLADSREFKGKEWSLLRQQFIELLGRPALAKHWKFLTEIAERDPDDLALAAAGKALGSFAKYDQKMRKEIVEKLVKVLSGKYNAKNDPSLSNTERQDAEETYNAIQGPWMSTLTKHTGQTQRDPMLWLRWWNNNKRKNWDKLGYVGVERKKDEDSDKDKKGDKKG